jgi:predicted ATP-binding protein involved in virulence
MEDIFIKSIKVNKVRNISDFQIPLDNDLKRNLIITGKNGSGKTSLLVELRKFLHKIIDGSITSFENNKKQLHQFRREHAEALKNKDEDKVIDLEKRIREFGNWVNEFGGTEITFNKTLAIPELFQRGEFIIAFFEAKRNTTLDTPKGVNLVELKPVYQINENAGKKFIQHVVNLKADRSFAKDENELETVKKIDNWFEVFESNLAKLFDIPIEFKFNRKEYNFTISEPGKEPYNLNQLSDGYSAILSIVTELIMRMEEHKTKSYDIQGVVLIDEIETHLHIDLQKKILPFLISFFPKIQFIATTHSPFIISSIENAIICDLEKKIVTTDLSGYSYDTLIESYFNADKYSDILDIKIKRFEVLMAKEDLSDPEKEELLDLKMYLGEIPKFVSDELAVKLQQIKLKALKKKE